MVLIEFVDVEENLRQGIQPVVVLNLKKSNGKHREMNKIPKLYVAGDVYSEDTTKRYAVYEQHGNYARIPITAYLTPRRTESDLFALGIEVMARFSALLLQLRVPIESYMVYIGKTCHLVGENQIRAYCGILARSE